MNNDFIARVQNHLQSSKNNVLNYSVIKNGSIGIKAEELASTNTPKILLANTIIKNMEVASLYSSNSHIEVFNCILINAGKYLVYAVNGGKYNLKQSTFSNFSSAEKSFMMCGSIPLHSKRYAIYRGFI